MKAALSEINSIPELRKFIEEADQVLGTVRFGFVEKWIKIPKKEALYLIRNIPDTETPKNCEMFGGTFGSLEIDDNTGKMTLYLG